MQPIEWIQAIKLTGKASPYIGEVLDAAFSNAQAIVVLLTGDDEAKLRQEYIKEDDPPYEKSLTPQARPNVLFEAGMALGRNPGRTIIIQLGQLRPFSDISGRHVVKLDNSLKKRQELVSKLQIAGCKVDSSGTDWYRVGDFQECVLPQILEVDGNSSSTVEGTKNGFHGPVQSPSTLFKTVPLEEISAGLMKELSREVLWGRKWRGIDKKLYRVIVSRQNDKYPSEVLSILHGVSYPKIIFEEGVNYIQEVCDLLQLHDIDADGHPEILYSDYTYGNRAGADYLTLVRCKDGQWARVSTYWQSNEQCEHASWLEFEGPLADADPYRLFLEQLALRSEEDKSKDKSNNDRGVLQELKKGWQYHNYPLRKGILKRVERKGRYYQDRLPRHNNYCPIIAGIEFETGDKWLRCPISSPIFNVQFERRQIVAFFKDGVYQFDSDETVFPIFIPDNTHNWCYEHQVTPAGKVWFSFRNGLRILYSPHKYRFVKIENE